MPEPRALDAREQVAGLLLIDFLLGLFTETPRESFTRDELLVTLKDVREMPALCDPAVVTAYDLATEGIDGAAEV